MMNNFNSEKILKFIEILFRYNKEVNLFSRKLSFENVERIVNETILFGNYVKNNNIIDAGSGNGFIGIPLAIIYKKKKVILVETKEKKVFYLNKLVGELNLKNVKIFLGGIINYFNENKINKDVSLVSRGFPNNYNLIKFLKESFVDEVVLITVEDKIKKISYSVDNIKKYVYNIPSKDKIKIVKLEKVSRGTIKKM